MLTLFTIPRLFRGEFETIQRNAIKSWTLLPHCPEIILFGDDEGTAQVAREFGALHIPDIARNEYGTPLLNDVFEKAQRLATHGILCYINADIILLSDFMSAVEQVVSRHRSFLVVGQRWNLDLTEAMDFVNPLWEKELRALLAEKGKLNPPSGIDYFVFPRNMYGEIPAFAIGRTAFDNWLIYRARFLHIRVIDATEVVTAIHQNHGFGHVPRGSEGIWKGPERDRNLELAGGFAHLFSLEDANVVLTPQGLKRPKPTIGRLLRHVETLAAFHPRLRFVVECLRHLWRAAKASYRKVTKFLGIKQWQ